MNKDKKKHDWLLCIIIVILLVLSGCSLSVKRNSNDESDFNKSAKAEKLLNSGDVFEKNSYIDVSGVRFLYDGKMFLVHNSNTFPVRLTYTIVGVKNDGSFDKISMSALSGVDKVKYEKDLSENGWAIEQYTNLVRANETLEASLELTEFLYFNEEFPSNDIDDDGYIDFYFTVSPQQNEEQIITSTDDTVSEIYRIKIIKQ